MSDAMRRWHKVEGGWIADYPGGPPGFAVTVSQAGVRLPNFANNKMLTVDQARWLSARLAEAAGIYETYLSPPARVLPFRRQHT